MRTTIDFDERLLRELKQESARRGITMRKLVQDSVKKELLDSRRRPKYAFRWKAHRGQLLPGVKLHDRKSLFDLLDGR